MEQQSQKQKPTIHFIRPQPLLTVSFYTEYQKVKYTLLYSIKILY